MALQLNRRYSNMFFEPVAESFEEGFWEGIKRRELVFQRCGQCRQWHHPPRPMCHKCYSYDMRWEKSTGKGVIHSFVIFTREVIPLYEVPFEVVLVDMDDEKPVRLLANMLDTKVEEIYIGMPVELDFYDFSPKQPLPIFRKRKA